MEKKIKQIVRIMNTDIPGEKSLYYALTRIKGIDFMVSNALCKASKIKKETKIGELTQEQINQIEEIIKNPKENKLPAWLLNRKRDPESGEDKHLVTSDLKLRTEFDIRDLKKIKSYRGMRHASGLPVRGQRTRSNFRRGGSSLGVSKKKVKQVQK